MLKKKLFILYFNFYNFTYLYYFSVCLSLLKNLNNYLSRAYSNGPIPLQSCDILKEKTVVYTL